jgi:hypothetical protein
VIGQRVKIVDDKSHHCGQCGIVRDKDRGAYGRDLWGVAVDNLIGWPLLWYATDELEMAA